MKQLGLTFVSGILFLASQAAWAAGDVAAGQQKAATCAACHGADGNSASPDFPKLAGQGVAYIVKQLKAYKDPNSGRANPIMAGMVASLSEQDMMDLAAYYEQQKRTPGAGDEKLIALGQNIFRGGITGSSIGACIGCHGPQGSGNPAAHYPAVSGQHAKYLLTQLQLFRSGERANDPGNMMRSIASRMTDDEMKAVAEYMAGLY